MFLLLSSSIWLRFSHGFLFPLHLKTFQEGLVRLVLLLRTVCVVGRSLFIEYGSVVERRAPARRPAAQQRRELGPRYKRADTGTEASTTSSGRGSRGRRTRRRLTHSRCFVIRRSRGSRSSGLLFDEIHLLQNLVGVRPIVEVLLEKLPAPIAEDAVSSHGLLILEKRKSLNASILK